ncbi:hypothetical protein ACFLUT_00365 [Chloroflexota bacterium]
MEKTWKPVAGGILAIVGGSLNLLVGLGLLLAFPAAMPFRVAFVAVGVLGVLFLATGAVALIGGISAVNRRRWGLSLAGGICAIVPPSTLLGILSTVFVALSRDEMQAPVVASPAPTKELPEPIEAVPVVASSDGAKSDDADSGCDPDFSEPSEAERNA